MLPGRADGAAAGVAGGAEARGCPLPSVSTRCLRGCRWLRPCRVRTPRATARGREAGCGVSPAGAAPSWEGLGPCGHTGRSPHGAHGRCSPREAELIPAAQRKDRAGLRLWGHSRWPSVTRPQTPELAGGLLALSATFTDCRLQSGDAPSEVSPHRRGVPPMCHGLSAAPSPPPASQSLVPLTFKVMPRPLLSSQDRGSPAPRQHRTGPDRPLPPEIRSLEPLLPLQAPNAQLTLVQAAVPCAVPGGPPPRPHAAFSTTPLAPAAPPPQSHVEGLDSGSSARPWMRHLEKVLRSLQALALAPS